MNRDPNAYRYKWSNGSKNLQEHLEHFISEQKSQMIHIVKYTHSEFHSNQMIRCCQYISWQQKCIVLSPRSHTSPSSSKALTLADLALSESRRSFDEKKGIKKVRSLNGSNTSNHTRHGVTHKHNRLQVQLLHQPDQVVSKTLVRRVFHRIKEATAANPPSDLRQRLHLRRPLSVPRELGLCPGARSEERLWQVSLIVFGFEKNVEVVVVGSCGFVEVDGGDARRRRRRRRSASGPYKVE
ncbi:hypothetical protein F8388_008960 [Cannabis sativa]|uniref:Ycf2 N-terminal domain-containing protein n=1 Tax=Cannabis sativa TaxID=3483 RepID=A0A7J6GFV1_CANSA|nr:hypothetical protein F8388_008960 [Cannabis sativa]